MTCLQRDVGYRHHMNLAAVVGVAPLIPTAVVAQEVQRFPVTRF